MLFRADPEIKIKKFSRKRKPKKKYNQIIIIIILTIILFINIFVYLKIFNNKINKINKRNDEIIFQLKDNFEKKLNKLEDIIKKNYNIPRYNKIEENEEFDEEHNKKIVKNQHLFCSNNDLFTDSAIESKIKKIRINYKNTISFYMYVYLTNDIVSNSIQNSGSWESSQTSILLKCLEYYAEKKKLPKNNITMVDIGANVGWYSFTLGKAGYEIISFEASHNNAYILKKNFCYNKDINITIINKGIDLEEKKCILHHPSNNVGNGVILCGENENLAKINKDLVEDISFTKLSNYISYLSKKNVALLKIDVEGSEGKVINSGIELITKYHVPFLFIEFRKDYLKMQETDPKLLLEIFVNNGYFLSSQSFFCSRYSSIEEILSSYSNDLYIVYSKILE